MDKSNHNLMFTNTLGYTKQSLILFLLIILAVFSAIVASTNGSFEVSVVNLIRGSATDLQSLVIMQIRLPRVILSALVGASLGLSGAALQGLFRNPLADPGLIGVSAGAALGAAIVIIISPAFLIDSSIGPFLLPLAGISGAAGVIFFLYLLTKGFGHQGVTYMLLVGIAVNAIAGVAIGILTYISSDAELRTLTFWTMGSFGGVTWNLLTPAIVVILGAMLYMAPAYRALDLVQLGEVEAYRLGVDVKGLKYRVIMSAAAAVGASVALSGMIGFVGLVVPHVARMLGGVSHRYLLPASATLGAALMISADMLARMVVQPAELPIGLITSAIGSPFFLWLIFRMKQNVY
jgi:iron complex transport system permease protein